MSKYFDIEREGPGQMKARISGYAIHDGDEYFVGNQYIAPGKTEAVWDEDVTRAKVYEYPTDAEKMAKSVGGDVVPVSFTIDI